MSRKEKLCNVRIITSNNRIEVYKYNNFSFKKGHSTNNEAGRSGKLDTTDDEKEVNTKINRKATLTEARNDIIRLIKCNESDMVTFCTLTFAKDISYEASKIHLRKFFRRLNDKYPQLKYLWVLELTQALRPHYHVLLNIDFGIKYKAKYEKKSEEHKLIEKQFAEKYWKNGFVDLKNLKADGVSNVALYVSSYLVKDLLEIEELNGQRVYGYSHKTMNKPTEFCYWSNETLEEFLKSTIENYDLIFTNGYKIGIDGNVNYFDMVEKIGGCDGNIDN